MAGTFRHFREHKGLSLTRREFLRGAGGLVAAAAGPLLSGCSTPGADTAEAADTVFHGGTILTMDAASPRAAALAARDGRILDVGPADRVLRRRGANTRVIDLGGRALLPGFIDPHVHSSLVAFEGWLDLGMLVTASMDDCLARLRKAVATAPAGQWVPAWQFDPLITPGSRPLTRSLLDEIAPDHPVFVLESNLHIGYANTRAFEQAGITRDTADPPSGRFLRDAGGDLTGRLEEAGAFLPFIARLPRLSPAEHQAALGRMFDRASSVGCTALFDGGIGGLGGKADLRSIEEAMAGDPSVRFRGCLLGLRWSEWKKLGLRPNQGTDRFGLPAIKFISDGSNQARTAWQREPYLGTNSRGATSLSIEQLAEDVREVHDAGWQVCIHANGDAAIDAVLDVYDTVLAKSPRRDHRHRIEHCTVLHADQIAKMKALGVSPSFLIGHVHYWGRAFRDEILGPERADLVDPCASALRAGLRISLHSDYNVTPIGPLRCMQNAVTRVMRDGGDVLNRAECLGVEAALRAVTLDAAWQCRLDHITGSLETGKYADLVLLEEDPSLVEPSKIASIKISETWLEGRRRFPA